MVRFICVLKNFSDQAAKLAIYGNQLQNMRLRSIYQGPGMYA